MRPASVLHPGSHTSDDPRSKLPNRLRLPLIAIATPVLAAIVSVFILHPFTPDGPHPGLDPSWMAVTGEAAVAHARWGVDIVFTYGPASPLVTNYFNDDYFSRTLPLMLAFSLVHGLCAAALLTLRSGRHRTWPAVSVLGIACYALALIAARQNPDAFYFCSIFLAYLLDVERRPPDRVARLATTLGVAMTGIFCLSKFSYGLCALPLFALGDVRAAWHRRPPFRLALMMASFLLAFLAYGQHAADLPAFLAMQKEIIAGYTDAMSIGGYRLETVAFLAGAGTFLLVVCGVEAAASGPWIDRLLLPLGLAAFFLVVFKAGFVRQDLHTLISWLSLALSGVAVAFGHAMARSRLAGSVLAALALASAVIAYPFMIAVTDEAARPVASMLGTYKQWFTDGPPSELAAMRGALADPGAFVLAQRRAKDQAWADIRKAFPRPAFDGTVDIIQSDQTELIANGLDYHPRPVFQEYSTYTAELMRANRAFYQGGKAPEWVIFAPGSIDERYPAFAEGALWPDLIRRYEPVSRQDANIILHRRPQPSAGSVGPATTRVGRWNELVPLRTSGPVFARIVVKPTLLGRLMALIYRSPLITMMVSLADGRTQTYRFVPALGAGGFVLSPVIASADDFARLALGIEDIAPRDIVTGVELVGDRLVTLANESGITFEFAPMAVPKSTDSDTVATLLAGLVPSPAWREIVRRAGRETTLDGDRLPLQPPDRFVMPLGNAHRLSFSYGIEKAAWSAPNRTAGVCFDLKSVGGGEEIWRRCLDPLQIEADRAEQSVVVDVPAGTLDVAIETSCRASCDWGWAYLKEARPVP